MSRIVRFSLSLPAAVLTLLLLSLALAGSLSATQASSVFDQALHKPLDRQPTSFQLADSSSATPAEQLHLPSVTILSPEPGAVTGRFVQVQFATSDHVVGPIQTDHIHFHLDNDPIPFMFFNGEGVGFGVRTVLYDFDPTVRATWVSTDTVRFNALNLGEHLLQVHLVDSEHNPYPNPEASATFTFTVDFIPDDLEPPDALLFVKQNKEIFRAFEHAPDATGDLYRMDPPFPGGPISRLTFVAEAGGGVLAPEVNWDGSRVAFAMRQNAEDSWHIWEMNVDGSGLRQLTFDPPYRQVNDLDPVYLPNGEIMFISDRRGEVDEYLGHISTQVYVMDANGGNMRLVDPNPSHSNNPTVFADGRIIFNRWDHLAQRNQGTVWHMNQNGSAPFVFYGGATPSPSDVRGLEMRELVDSQAVGIFTERDSVAGLMGIFNNLGGNLEDLPNPVYVGGSGLFRTPAPFTTNQLVYSRSEDSPGSEDFGLYILDWTTEEVLLHDATVSTANPPFNFNFRNYTVNLDSPGRWWVEVRGNADSNGPGDDDDLGIKIDGRSYGMNNMRSLNGDDDLGLSRTIRIYRDDPAGQHAVNLFSVQTPTVTSVKVVKGSRWQNAQLLYNDPETFELWPTPVRMRTTPPALPGLVDPGLDYGEVIVRDVSLRGDFRQPNFHMDWLADPDLPYHLRLDAISDLRVFMSQPRRSFDRDLLVVSSSIFNNKFEAVRVLGRVTPNASGAVTFLAPAQESLAWDLLDRNGGALVHERMWLFLQPGETRVCGGCHVPTVPFLHRDVEPFLPATDLVNQGEIFTFETHALPILQEKCQTCHFGDFPPGGLRLTGTRGDYEDLLKLVGNRLPKRYLEQGDAKYSFFWQLLTGDAFGDDAHQARIDAINAETDHVAMLTPAELYDIATWIDTGAGFIFLPEGLVSQPPSVSKTWPAAGATEVPPNSRLVVEFSHAMDRATVRSYSFSLNPAAAPPTLQATGPDGEAVPLSPQAIAGSWQWGLNHIVSFAPDGDLAANTTYELTISAGAADVSGNGLSPTFAGSFTTGSEQDVAAPAVVAWHPPASDASVSSPVEVRFSEALDAATVKETSFYVRRSGNFRPLAGTIHLSQDGTRLAFVPDSLLAPNTTYEVFLSSQAADLAGNPLGQDQAYSFTTASTAASPIHSLRADRALGLLPSRLTVSPNGDWLVAPASASNEVYVLDARTFDQVAVHQGVGDGPRQAIVTPDNSAYWVVNSTSNDLRLIDLATGGVLGTVSGAGDPVSAALSPDGRAAYVADASDNSLKWVDADPASPTFLQVLGSVLLSSDPRSVAVAPDGSTVYVTTVTSVDFVDPQALRLRQAANLTNAYGIAVTPDGRQAHVANCGLLNQGGHVNVLDLASGIVVARLPVDDCLDEVALHPAGQWGYATYMSKQGVLVYDRGINVPIETLRTDGQKAEGLAVAPDGSHLFVARSGWPGQLWAYALADAGDVTPPQVAAVSPADGSSNVPIAYPVVVEFGEEVDRLSVTEDSIQVLQITGESVDARPEAEPAGEFVIAGSLTLAENNRQARFLPEINWQLGALYRVRITSDVRDLAHNPLAGPVETTFIAAALPPPQPIGLLHEHPGAKTPRALALTPDGQTVLVGEDLSDDLSDDLLLIATDSGQRTKLDLWGRPEQAAVTPDGKKAYISLQNVNQVAVVDLATSAIIDMDPGAPGNQGIAVGVAPYGLILDPVAGRLYVVNKSSQDVSVIDVETDAEIARYSLNGADSALLDAAYAALNSDGSRLYVSRFHGVTVLDLSSGSVLTDIELAWSNLRGLWVNPDESLLFVASLANGEVNVIDLASGQVVDTLLVNGVPEQLLASPDGETLYLLSSDIGIVSVIDWRSGTIVNHLSRPGLFMEAWGLAISADGNRIYASMDGTNQLLAYALADPSDDAGPRTVNLALLNAVQLVNVATSIAAEFDETLDRNSINTGSFQVVRPITVSESINNSMTPAQPAALGGDDLESEIVVAGSFHVSPDNTRVDFLPLDRLLPGTRYWLRLNDGLKDLAGNSLITPGETYFTTAWPLQPSAIAQRAETYASSRPEQPVLSPDGSLLAVANHGWNTVSLLNPATLQPLHVVTVGAGPVGLAFRPDGGELYVGNTHDGTLSVIDPAAGQVIDIITGVGDEAQDIVVNAVGSHAYVASRGDDRVSEVDLAARSVSRTWNLPDASHLALSPDGADLYVGANGLLARIDLAASSVRTLNLTSGVQGGLLLSPDGERVYVLSPAQDRMRVVHLGLWLVMDELLLGDEPASLTASSDGRLLIVINARGSTFWLVDAWTNQVVGVWEVEAGWLNGAAYDAGRQRLYLALRDAGQVLAYDAPYTPCDQWDMDCSGVMDILDVQFIAEQWNNGQITIAEVTQAAASWWSE